MKLVFQSLVLLAGVLFSLNLLAQLLGEVLWFEALGYFSVLLTRLQTQGLVWLVVVGVSLLACWGNLSLAERLKYTSKPLNSLSLQPTLDQKLQPQLFGKEQPSSLEPQRQSRAISLGMVLLIGSSLGSFLGILILYYSRLIRDRWQPDWTVPNISPQSIERLNPLQLLQNLLPITDYPLQWAGLIVLPILLLWFPRTLLRGLAITLSLGLGVILPAHWAQILQAFHPVSFQQTDPLFNLDISFYIYQLPIWELIEFWTFGVASFSFVAVTLIYLLCDNTLSNGEFPGFSRAQQRHLQGIGSALMGVLALSNGLQRYGLLYSDDGAAYGASYADVTTKLPAYTALAWLAIAISILLLWQALSGTYPLFRHPRARRPFDSRRNATPQTLIPPLYLILSGYAIAALVSTRILPELVQQAIVQPNELAREAPYLDRNIAYTRQSFDLNTIDVQTFNPTANLDEAALAANDLTIRNIRLWDTRPLLETNRQLQQIRLYYRFPNADIGRYSIPRDVEEGDLQSLETRQVILAARELDFDAVPSRAQTWINKHLVYTHGYGFTMSPVNTATPNGLPEYFVRGIAGGEDDQGSEAPIEAANERIRQSIPIGSPRIYYGELTHNYVMTSTGVQEFDYPQGEENVYNVYDGDGGVTIGTGWRRWLYAVYLRDWRMLLTDDFRPETKLLFRRNIDRRVRSIAPFLRYDHDPYLVVANVEEDSEDDEGAAAVTGNTLYWILDAYTTSDRYPYADPGEHPFNYIRNSVKVVIDAYNGSVQFYIADDRDPIIQSYHQIFPDLFQPFSAMPPPLRQHIRYPIDFFEVQSERLLTYNMTDTQVFYNREDQWEVPMETYRDQQQTVEPYYLIMKLPGETSEEFILLHPFTPRRRANLIAWLAGRSDGENYGRLLLYQFPKQELIYGPGQIEARINQDPLISQQLSLWNRQGSRVIQGNLLVIPIDESLLYVEPLYLEADQNALPTLVRVIVAYENQIVMAPNLDRAFEAIFEPERLPDRSIIRSIEGLFPGFADDPPDTAPLPDTVEN
ncbi:UPF0182 family protein [Sodalinema gerasimenkoae]|uniref:UPF0182 family protein n=1 Tax=Sodalinema gerasimenkoae TaxID=2862348 RepID=UPI001FEBC0DC|nr:UPF0182 family protein [Sodalinema gerasimenkoae]